MRTKNVIKNFKYGVFCQILNLFIQFVSRTIFIKFLGTEYLGVNGLFTNILTILSLADLGIGNVLIFSMYKPLAENDEKKVNLLLKEYKKIYRYIALIILIIGLLLMPFVENFVNGTTTIKNLKFIFILYLLNTVFSYLCIYRISIINADQKNYYVNIVQQIFNLIANVVMIIILYLTHNFIAYLLIKIIFSILCNIFLSKKASKMYPYINSKIDGNISIKEKKRIFKDTRAMLCHKIGGVIVCGTDNILISYMVNIATVGIYSNYLLITNSVKNFANIFFSSMSSSVGNLNAKKNKKYTYEIFKKVFYANFLIYSFSSICLYCLLNPFIEIWLGKEFIFNKFTTLCITVSFFLDGMRQTVMLFRNSMGLFQQDQWKPIVESIANLLISIILGLKFGITGIILGTILSLVFVSIFVETKVLYKYGFEVKVFEYFKTYLKYLLITGTSLIITLTISNSLNSSSVLNFIFKLILTSFTSILLLLLFTFKTDEFKYYFDKFKTKFKNLRKINEKI